MTVGSARATTRLGWRSLRVRIATAILAAVGSMIGVVAWLVAQQEPVRLSLHVVTEGYLPLATQVARLRQDQLRVQRDLNRLSKGRPRPTAGESTAAEIYTQDLRADFEVARALAGFLQERAGGAEEVAVLRKTVAYLDAVEAAFSRYQTQSGDYLKAAGGQSSEALEALRRPMRATERTLSDELDRLQSTVEGRIRQLTAESEQRQQRATAVASALVVAASLLMLALTAAVLAALRPVGRLTDAVVAVASGEDPGQLDVGGRDEIGVLAREFARMMEAIALRDHRLHERAGELDRLSRYLGSVLDALRDGLVVVEAGVVTLANPAATTTWGLVVGEPVPEALRGLVDEGGALTSPAGASYVVRSVAFGAQGRVAVLSDVTDQARAQERLARSERLATVGQMLAQVTHEVRNPLNALSLNAELLADEIEALDPERRSEAWEIHAMIAREIERLTSLTGHYLQLARRPPTDLQPVELGALLADVGRLLGPELEAAGASLRVDGMALPPRRADPQQLRQAVLNLVRNAVEAGATAVVLSLREVDGEVRVVVSDNGTGMSAEEAAQAVEPFYSTKAQGTGLGLAVTRQILDDHDGVVRIESGASGTQVTLAWPATDDEEVG